MRKEMIRSLSYMREDATVELINNLSNKSLDGLCAMLSLPFDGGDRYTREQAILRRAAMLRGDRRLRQRRTQRRFHYAHA